MSLVALAGAALLPFVRREAVSYRAHGAPDSAALEGRLVDGDGRPFAGVAVKLFEPDSQVGLTTVYRGSATTTTGADGTFRFEGLRSGEVWVGVEDAARRCEGRSGEVELRSGHVATDLVVRGHEIAAARYLRGRLRTPDGKPVAHRLVTVGETTWLGQWQVGVSTDADGRFELLAPHAHAEGTFRVHGVDEPEAELGQVRFGADDVDLVLSPRR